MQPQHGTIPSASRAAISVRATAALTAICNARRPRQVVRPGATPIRFSEKTASCSPAVTARSEGGSDAYSRSDDSCGRRRPCLACVRPDLRPRLSGLPARLWSDHLLRVRLYLAGPVQCLSVGTLGAVRDQSLFRERGRELS